MFLYFIRKSIVTICLNVAVCVLGFFALPQIANEFIPAIEIPAVAVVFPTTLLSPEQVVQNLVEPSEKRLMDSGQVEHIETTVEAGRAISLIYFKWDYKPEECLQRTRQIVGSIHLPPGALAPIFVLHRPTLSPIIRVVLHGKNGNEEISRLTSMGQGLTRSLERADGVAEARLVGATSKIGVIEPDLKRMAALKTNLSSVVKSATETWSFRYLMGSSPGDLVRLGINRPEDLGQLPVSTQGGNSVPLRWVADIKESSEKPTVFFGKGEASVILEVLKAPGADALSIADKVEEALKDSERENPNLAATVIYNEAEKIRAAQKDVFHNFRDGIILNSFILIFFLGSISGCVIASCVFPTSILGALVIMKSLGISFNIFSLNGFSLATGMITDAATVLLDSIMRRIQAGEETESACWKGTKDVANGVFTGVITSCAVLFPVCLQSGVSSKLFGDLAVTLIASNLLCLIGVYTMVPWLSSKLLKTPKPGDAPPIAPVAFLFRMSTILVGTVTSVAIRVFDRSLKDARFRTVLPLAVSSLCLGSLLFMPPSELLPMVKANVYAVTVPMKSSVLQANGESLQKEMNRSLGQESTVEWSVTSRDSDTINATLMTKEKAPVEGILKNLAAGLGVDMSKVLSFPLGPTPPTEPMNYSGYFYIGKSILAEKRIALAKRFCETKGIEDCTGVGHYTQPRILLKDLPLNMARSGVNPVATAVEGGLGVQRLDLASLANLPFSYPVLLDSIAQEQAQSRPSDEGPTRTLGGVTESAPSLVTQNPMASGKNGGSIQTLGSFYNVGVDSVVSKIFRADLNEYEPLYFRLGELTLGQAVSKMEKLQEELSIPLDSVRGMGGIMNMAETFKKMTFALLMAALLVYAILFMQFKSLVKATIIMLSIPQAIGGAIFGLIVMHETMNAGVIVGFVLLIGIIVSSGIYLTEALDHSLEHGLEIEEAIREAIKRRVRPILMTKFSCIFGMLPILLFESEGQELYRGMAIVNIFGLCTGTVLTLGVAPILIRRFVKVRHAAGVVKPALQEAHL